MKISNNGNHLSILDIDTGTPIIHNYNISEVQFSDTPTGYHNINLDLYYTQQDLCGNYLFELSDDGYSLLVGSSSNISLFRYYPTRDHWCKYDVNTFRNKTFLSSSINHNGEKILISDDTSGVYLYTFNTGSETFDISGISDESASSVSINSTGDTWVLGYDNNNNEFKIFDNGLLTSITTTSPPKIVDMNSYGDIVSVEFDEMVRIYARSSINNTNITQQSSWEEITDKNIQIDGSNPPSSYYISNDGYFIAYKHSDNVVIKSLNITNDFFRLIMNLDYNFFSEMKRM